MAHPQLDCALSPSLAQQPAIPCASTERYSWNTDWGTDIDSGEPFFEGTMLPYACTLPPKSNGKGAASPEMEVSGGAGPASPIPASSRAQSDLCDFPSAPVSELEGRGGFPGIP